MDMSAETLKEGVPWYAATDPRKSTKVVIAPIAKFPFPSCDGVVTYTINQIDILSSLDH